LIQHFKRNRFLKKLKRKIGESFPKPQ